jgi:hypothetical protein
MNEWRGCNGRVSPDGAPSYCVDALLFELRGVEVRASLRRSESVEHDRFFTDAIFP